jgi:hypothetical protein
MTKCNNRPLWRGWCVFTKKGQPFCDTASDSRRGAIVEFLAPLVGDSDDWQHWRCRGYTVRKVRMAEGWEKLVTE